MIQIAKKKKKQEDKAAQGVIFEFYFSAQRKRRVDAEQAASGNGKSADSNGDAASFRQCVHGSQEAAPPNNLLFIQNLPHETTSMMLQVLHGYQGFREVRMIEVKPGIAFVEYEDDMHSSMAMQALQGFQIAPLKPMIIITYAKK